jgi:uncharacterized protein (TIGR00288 family)
MEKNKRIALLIDCDNISHNHVKGVFNELANYGTVNVRHAHGDFNSPHLSGWVSKLQDHAIRPMQQFAYSKGKNATDCALIIDAMDLLYSNTVDAFALMTSDSDFTSLAIRIIESGLPVYGFGEDKTPKAFSNACSTFIYNEKVSPTTVSKGKKVEDPLKDADLVKNLLKAFSMSVDDTGWAPLGEVGRYIANNRSFSVINYGHSKLGDLIKATGLFETEIRNGSSLCIKPHKKKPSKK